MDTSEVVSANTRESVDRLVRIELSLPHKPEAITGAVIAELQAAVRTDKAEPVERSEHPPNLRSHRLAKTAGKEWKAPWSPRLRRSAGIPRKKRERL